MAVYLFPDKFSNQNVPDSFPKTSDLTSTWVTNKNENSYGLTITITKPQNEVPKFRSGRCRLHCVKHVCTKANIFFSLS